jgi:hypothetical protein
MAVRRQVAVVTPALACRFTGRLAALVRDAEKDCLACMALAEEPLVLDEADPKP